MKEPLHKEGAEEAEQPQRKLAQKRAAPERAERIAKKGRLELLDTQDIPQEAASPADEQALSTGAVKPETPAKVSRAPCRAFAWSRQCLSEDLGSCRSLNQGTNQMLALANCSLPASKVC